jgi:hypothetical protein
MEWMDGRAVMPNMISKVSLGYILSLSDLWYCICFGNVRDAEVYMYSLLHGTRVIRWLLTR